MYSKIDIKPQLMKECSVLSLTSEHWSDAPFMADIIAKVVKKKGQMDSADFTLLGTSHSNFCSAEMHRWLLQKAAVIGIVDPVSVREITATVILGHFNYHSHSLRHMRVNLGYMF